MRRPCTNRYISFYIFVCVLLWGQASLIAQVDTTVDASSEESSSLSDVAQTKSEEPLLYDSALVHIGSYENSQQYVETLLQEKKNALEIDVVEADSTDNETEDTVSTPKSSTIQKEFVPVSDSMVESIVDTSFFDVQYNFFKTIHTQNEFIKNSDSKPVNKNLLQQYDAGFLLLLRNAYTILLENSSNQDILYTLYMTLYVVMDNAIVINKDITVRVLTQIDIDDKIIINSLQNDIKKNIQFIMTNSEVLQYDMYIVAIDKLNVFFYSKTLDFRGGDEVYAMAYDAIQKKPIKIALLQVKRQKDRFVEATIIQYYHKNNQLIVGIQIVKRKTLGLHIIASSQLWFMLIREQFQARVSDNRLFFSAGVYALLTKIFASDSVELIPIGLEFFFGKGFDSVGLEQTILFRAYAGLNYHIPIKVSRLHANIAPTFGTLFVVPLQSGGLRLSHLDIGITVKIMALASDVITIGLNAGYNLFINIYRTDILLYDSFTAVSLGLNIGFKL